jgi:hypothetical protein
MSHYLPEEGVTHKPSSFTTFYYPPKMFADAQTSLNVLVTRRGRVIAAYLVGVRDSAPPICAPPPPASWASRATIARSLESSLPWCLRTAGRSRASSGSRKGREP